MIFSENGKAVLRDKPPRHSVACRETGASDARYRRREPGERHNDPRPKVHCGGGRIERSLATNTALLSLDRPRRRRS